MSTQQPVSSGKRRTHNPIMYDEIISFCHQAGICLIVILETALRSTAIGLVTVVHRIAAIAESLKHSCVTCMRLRPLAQPGPIKNYSYLNHS